MSLGKFWFMDLEFDLDEIINTTRNLNLSSTVQYDPQTAFMPDLAFRIAVFGFAMLAGVCVTLAISEEDIRSSPPKYAMGLASALSMLPAHVYVPFHTYCFQGAILWKAIATAAWLMLSPWKFMQYATQAKDLLKEKEAKKPAAKKKPKEKNK